MDKPPITKTPVTDGAETGLREKKRHENYNKTHKIIAGSCWEL